MQIISFSQLQILSVFSRKLQWEYDEKSTGSLYMQLDSEKKPEYDIRLYNHMPQGGLHSGIANQGFFALIGTVLFLGPFLLHTKGGQLIKSLQQSRNKAKVPFFWAVASLAHVVNTYFIFKVQIATCYPYKEADLNIRNCIVSNVILLYIFITVSIIVYVHSKYATFPIPKSWQVLMKCCGRKKTQNHYNGISLGDLHVCSGSIRMSPISSLDGECQSTLVWVWYSHSVVCNVCMHHPFLSQLIKSSSKKRNTGSHQIKHFDR